MICAAACACLLAASCAPSTPLARIQREPGKFEALPVEQRALVEQGRIGRGMTHDAVYLAWGAPSGVLQGWSGGRETERWDYNGTRAVHFTGFYGAFGGYSGPYRRYGYSDFGIGPETVFIPYRVASVWFVNGRVDAWERLR
jgi:hypothetical protein